MTRFADAGHPGVWMQMFREAVEVGCAAATSLEAAAQATAAALYQGFSGSMVLVRLFATVPVSGLPPDIHQAAAGMAASSGLALGRETPVLALLGTAGVEEEWRDRRRSKGHAGIPLISSAFVAAIPMIARALEEIGMDLKAFDVADRQPYVEAGLFKSGAFHVPDAATATDAHGRKVISAQDFVRRHAVVTVFGASAAFLGTSIAATLICFTRDALEPEVSQAALTGVSQFRAITQRLANDRKLFSAGT